MDKIIITAAITGSRMMRDVAPHIPITPEEISLSAYEAWQAGASIVHIHVRIRKQDWVVRISIFSDGLWNHSGSGPT